MCGVLRSFASGHGLRSYIWLGTFLVNIRTNKFRYIYTKEDLIFSTVGNHIPCDI